MLGANRELILLYWRIGQVINGHKTWGSKFVENLAADIKLEFPAATGYSVRNLKYMAKFAASYSDEAFVQQVVAQIPWGQNVVLLDKVPDPAVRCWYLEACVKNGWSRNVLVHQIESGLYERQVLSGKVNNFAAALPPQQSELARQMMKDPYIFDFIPFHEDMVERDIERALVSEVTRLLLCKTKNDLVAEYSLKDVSKPIGISAYRVTGVLPEELRGKLPSIEDIQNRIGLGD